MKKKPSFAPLVIYVIILASLWDTCEDTIEYLFLRTPPSLMKFRVLWARNPQAVIMLVLFLIFCLLLIVSFFSLLGSASSGKASSVHEPRTRSGPQGKKSAEKLEADEAIHCAHLRGREKYLEQIDNYLKTGLIDRSEYRVLKERYMKLDIPEDYH